jgi:hypothetical protein
MRLLGHNINEYSSVFCRKLSWYFRSGRKIQWPESPEKQLPKNNAAEAHLCRYFGGLMLRSRLSRAVLFAAFAGLLPGPAGAGEIPYAVAVGANEQLSGVVYVDDSSGEVASAKGAASGAVRGDFTLDRTNSDVEMHGAAAKLDVHLDRKSQQLRARLDACPASLDSCSPGIWVTLWEQ